MRRAMSPEGYAALTARHADTTPLGRIATAEDVAAAIVWLVEGADFITGELLPVDGGIRLSGGGKPPAKSPKGPA
jgi:3-oxoacyl-[acyl-carrier protein] reductase